MLNSLASKIISSIFSKYIETIDPSQLEVAIWSGSVHLENVNIQPNALSIHSLPFTVKKGIIGSIDLKFPWTKLSSEPCEITIKNILIVANITENIIATADSDLKAFVQNPQISLSSQNDINDMDQNNGGQKVENPETSRGGVLTGLLGKIVDNLKFHVENVHIRIEIPILNETFAIGFTLAEINAISVDENGDPVFVSEDTPLLIKLAKIKDMALYIDPSVTEISLSAFIKEMIDEINSDHEYILNPFTFETTIKNHRTEDFDFKTDLKVNTKSVNLFFSEQQWKCVNEMQRQYNMFNRRRLYMHCGRPDRMPRSERSATMWWKYAHRAALDKNQKEKFDPVCALQILKNRKEYSSLYSENLKLHRRDSIELNSLEDTLDTNAIAMLRVLSQTEYELNSPIIPTDSQEIFDLGNNDNFSGPFRINLLIELFNVTLSNEEGKSITRMLSKSLEMNYKKSGFDSISDMSFQTFQLINDLNPTFPFILSTDDETSSKPLIVRYKSKPNTPPVIKVSAPPINFVFDFGWIKSLIAFFSKEKAQIGSNEKLNNLNGSLDDKENVNELLPATIVQIQKAIEQHVAYNISISITRLIMKILYEEVEGDHHLEFNLNKIQIKSAPNIYLDTEDYTSLYDNYDITVESLFGSIDGRQVTNVLPGKILVDNAIISSDLFASMKIDVFISSEIILNITTFEFNLLLEMIFYLQDIYSQFSSYEGTFDPELNIIFRTKSATVNVFYEERHLYQLWAKPLTVNVIFKDFYDDIRVYTNKFLIHDYFSNEKQLLLDTYPTNENLSCLVMITNQRREVTVDLGEAILYGRSKPINFLINFFRFSKDYEVRLNLKDVPDSRQIWHTSPEVESQKLEINVLASPFTCFMENDLAKLKSENIKFVYWYIPFGYDIFIDFLHPIITTEQLNEYKVILDTNPSVPLKLEFHTFSLAANFVDTKFTLQYLWFMHLVRYFSSLLDYGIPENCAPNSMIYNDINVDIRNLELTMVYKSDIKENLLLKTPHLVMKTLKLPVLFQFIVNELDIFHQNMDMIENNQLFIKTPFLNIDMSMDLAIHDEKDLFAEIPHEKDDLKEMISKTNHILYETHPTKEFLNSIHLWIIGMGMKFHVDDLFIDYNHHRCHTLRKCIYSLWEYDGPPDTYSMEFDFYMKFVKAHLLLNSDTKFADILLNDFVYHVNQDQDITFGDLSIFPLNEKDFIYNNEIDNGNIVINLDKGNAPSLVCSYIKNIFTMNIGHLNIYLHPTFAFPLLYYIIGCPLFGEKDDPPSEVSTTLVFNSENMLVSLFTKKSFSNFILSFGLQWEWGQNEFFINLVNFTGKYAKRNTPIIQPMSIQYKRVPEEGKYIQRSSMTDLKVTITLSDLILFNSMLNHYSNIFGSDSQNNANTSKNSTSNNSNQDNNPGNNEIDNIDFRSMDIEILLCHSHVNVSSSFPFMMIYFKPFTCTLSPKDDKKMLTTSITSTIKTMNYTTGKWDLLIEPFTIDTIFTITDNYKELSVISSDEIDINVPSIFVKQLMQFDLNYLSESTDLQSTISSNLIENRTGSSVMIFFEDDTILPLSVGARVPLPNLKKGAVLSVSFGDSIDQLCNFKPDCIIYPMFIHPRCVVNSIPYKGARLITLSSPFAVINKTSRNLDIYTFNNKDKIYLGTVKAQKSFHIPFNVFLKTGFFFADPSIPIEKAKCKIFKHKKWTTKLNRNLDIMTEHGVLSCKAREEIDQSQSIGQIIIFPAVTFYNEMPVKLIIELFRSKNNIVLEPGEHIDVATIGGVELNFMCRVKIDGFNFSNNKIISLSFNSAKPSRFHMPKDDNSSFIRIATMTNHSIDRSQASIIFYCPCIIFNLFSKPIIVKPFNEESIFYSHEYKSDLQMIYFASKRFFQKQELFAHLQIPEFSSWSEKYIDCTASGMSDVIFLPKLNDDNDKGVSTRDKNIFVPIRYRVTQAEMPYLHSSVLTLVPALSIFNEMDTDIILSPHFASNSSLINENNQQINLESINEANHEENKEKESQGLENERFKPKEKTPVLWSNNDFSFDFSIDGFEKCQNILLSSPVRTTFRLFSDNEYIIIECEIVEDGFGLCAHFRKPRFPSPYILCNYLSDISLYGYQINKNKLFNFPPMSTSIFAFDAPFAEQAMVLKYENKSIIVHFIEETQPLPLNGTPFTIEMRTVNSGSRMIIISQDPVIKMHQLFEINVVFNGMAISFIDSLLRELCLITFGPLEIAVETTQTDITTKISLDYFQIDDQCTAAAFPVVLSGKSTEKKRFLEIDASFYRDAPLLLAFKRFIFSMQKITVYGDLAFVSDIYSYIFETVYHTGKRVKSLLPPSQSPESESVGRIYSFRKLRINPILLKVNYRSVTGRPLTMPTYPQLPLTLFKLVGNITGANICLNCIVLKNFRAPMSYLQRNLIDQYTNSFMNQIWALTGHSDILFNTVGIAESFTSGVDSYFYNPDEEEENIDSSLEQLSIESSDIEDENNHLLNSSIDENLLNNEETSSNSTNTNGHLLKLKSQNHKKTVKITKKGDNSEKEITPGEAAERTKKAVGSIIQSSEGFIRGISSLFSIGTFGSRSLTTGGLNQTPEDTIKDGFISLGTGIIDGIVGVVMDPIEGGKKDGVKGAFVGLGKGLAGIVMKPVVGVLDASAGLIGGIRQTLNTDQTILTRQKLPHAYLLSRIETFDPTTSDLQFLIQRHGWNSRNVEETLCAFIDDPTANFLFCLCSRSIYILKRGEKFDVEKSTPIIKVINPRCEGIYLKFSLKNIMKKGQKEDYVFKCRDDIEAEQIAMVMYSQLIAIEVFK
ncbi:hypothetical protein TRFO_22617 [Tritrichomonas foetus]|uniref:Chorein N-terminal domain-containing protein n=1 Tax=Tritrichomonas foetus TaxID=1144522 RepID=A0A1J4KBK0_9EUKA|nr:hypothetical protein TRFO_22617 [Tritrichomonas foetus]|eukprot:OHT08783.1 hypothetical protein TRFO_22617 [Tritrichomonas foetus]